MGRDFFPRGDAAALGWMVNFKTLVEADWARYALTESDARQIARVVGEFGEALQLAKSPATRTPATVAEKDRLRALAERVCRGYVRRLRPNAGIADSDKLALGVRLPRRGRPPEIPAPATLPVLGVLRQTPGRQVLTYRDSETPGRSGKPRGVTALEVYCAIADGPVREVSRARPWGAATRTPFVSAVGTEHRGKVATYFARWMTSRGRVGPWSLPVSMTIAA